MPTYEMPLLIRALTKPQTAAVLKRTAETIFQTGGFIRKIDNLGKLPTPYKISQNSSTHREANYFILHFDAPPSQLEPLLKENNRDVDILRVSIYASEEGKQIKTRCTLHEELLPPAYRPDVQEMLKVGEKQKAKSEKNKFKFNTGLDYYPFQR